MVENIIICLTYLLSGLIILGVFDRFGMRVARTAFLTLFCILLLYIPFYFGGQITLKLYSYIFTDKVMYARFAMHMCAIIEYPFAFMSLVSIISAVMALFMITAAIAVIINTALAVLCIIKNVIKRKPYIRISDDSYENIPQCFENTKRAVYLELCRLLN